MYDMDMRDYDPAIGRWVAQDPVVHFDYSPYSAFDNNPVFWADPTGADSEKDYLGRDTRDENGNYIASNNRGEMNLDKVSNLEAESDEKEESSDSESGDNGDPKKKKKTETRTDPNTSIDHYDGFTNCGDDSSPPIQDVSDEEMARRNSLFIFVVTAPLDATGLASITKLGFRVYSRYFIKQVSTKGGMAAYETALAGGKHSGFLKNYLGRSTDEINKAIRSMQSGNQGISVHLDKIANPSKYVPNWNALRSSHQHSLLNGWQNTVTKHSEQIQILQTILGK